MARASSLLAVHRVSASMKFVRQSSMAARRSWRAPPQKLARPVTPASEPPARMREDCPVAAWHVAQENALLGESEALGSEKSALPWSIAVPCWTDTLDAGEHAVAGSATPVASAMAPAIGYKPRCKRQRRRCMLDGPSFAPLLPPCHQGTPSGNFRHRTEPYATRRGTGVDVVSRTPMIPRPPKQLQSH